MTYNNLWDIDFPDWPLKDLNAFLNQLVNKNTSLIIILEKQYISILFDFLMRQLTGKIVITRYSSNN